MRVFRRKKSKKVKKWKGGGVFFCKKVDLSSTQGALCTVSVFLYFTFYLFGGAYAPNASGLKTIRARRATAMRLHVKSLWPLVLILAPL